MNSRIHFAILSLVLSCNLTNTYTQFRVRNGVDIDIELTPHTVAIFENYCYVCAGTLVNENSVVTLAHCFESRELADIILLAGVTFLSDLYTNRGQKRKVREVHGLNRNPRSKYMDIAVAKVDEPFIPTTRVKSIPLCQRTLGPGLSLQISGWGSSSTSIRKPNNHLKTTESPIIDRTYCQQLFLSKETPRKLPETIICAGYNGNDPCFGDSGAGGIVRGQLCAVVQGGCELGCLPSLFTDVTHPKVKAFLMSVI